MCHSPFGHTGFAPASHSACSRVCRPLFKVLNGAILLMAFILHWSNFSYGFPPVKMTEEGLKEGIFYWWIDFPLPQLHRNMQGWAVYESFSRECSSSKLLNRQQYISFSCNMLIGFSIWWDLLLLRAQNLVAMSAMWSAREAFSPLVFFSCHLYVDMKGGALVIQSHISSPHFQMSNTWC